MTIYCNNSILQLANQTNVFGNIPMSGSVGGTTIFGGTVGMPSGADLINTWGCTMNTPYINEDTFIPETPLPSATDTAFASMAAMQMANMQMPMMPAMQMPNFNFNPTMFGNWNFNFNSLGFSGGNSNKLQRICNTCAKYMGKTRAEMRKLLEGAGIQYHGSDVYSKGNLWCADGGRFFLEMALGRNGLPKWYRDCHYPSCPAVYNAAKKANAIVTEKKNGIDKSKIKPGMIVLLTWKGSSPQHFSIFRGWGPNGEVLTYEANTTPKGKTNGAYNQTRKLSEIYAVIDVT